MDVSVIIVNWNTKELLTDCLNSVYEQNESISFEVIVVDNASADGSCEMIRDKFPQVVLIENRENRGFAAANNQGIAIAKGRYVLLLNSDTLVLDKVVEKMVWFADRNRRAAVFGCRVLNPDGTLQRTCFMFPSVVNMLLSASYLYNLFPRNSFFGRERMTWWDRSDVREVDVVTGCFMLVRNSAIEEIGVLDERFFMYGEETDWCYRFKQSGWKVVFAPVGQIVHYGGGSSYRRSEMMLQLKGSILLYVKKHKSRASYILACFLVSLFFFLRIPYHFCRTLLAGDSRYSGLRVERTYLRGAFRALTGVEGLCLRK